MELTAVAVAVRFAALPPQGIERSWEERFSCQAILKQLRKLLLELGGLPMAAQASNRTRRRGRVAMHRN